MAFLFHKTELDGVIVVEPKIFEDFRGVFIETYKNSEFIANGINVNFVQDNYSRSGKDVVRGLHFQTFPKQQAKLVRCTKGKILDVTVDLRPKSKTFGKWFSIELSEENKKMLYIPHGFAHGFSVLSGEADTCYKVSEEYSPTHDTGILWNDKELNIDWQVKNPIISEKDKNLQSLREYKVGISLQGVK